MDTDTLTVAEATCPEEIKFFNMRNNDDDPRVVNSSDLLPPGVGMARVAQFLLGQTNIRACVPFLVNRDNVI